MDLPDMKLGVAAALVDGVLVAGDVEIRDRHVTAVGVGGAGRGIAAPGFVDVQINGFAGVDLLAADVEAYATVGAALAATGVIAYCPTFISSPQERLLAALRVLDAVAAAGRPDRGARPLGAHLEGPFLAPARAGTHPVEHLREPDPALFDAACEAGPVRLVTLAPELPGALDVIRRCVERGVVVSLGHSEASAAEADAGFAAGATAVTHLFNAMARSLAPGAGLASAALAHPHAMVSVIADGVHVDDELIRVAWRAVGDRLVLVTDAIAGAGMPDGEFDLGDVRVTTHRGEARRADGTLAGSVLTMDQAVRNLADLGVPLHAALGAATTAPRRLLGEPSAGLAPGVPADVVVLDDDLAVRRVLICGIDVLA